MPSFRWWNLLTIKANIEWAVRDLSKINWDILVFRDLYDNFPDFVLKKLKESWINIIPVKNTPKGLDICYDKLNQYAEMGPDINDRYYILCDDDMVLKDIDVLAEKMTSEVLIISMKRGSFEKKRVFFRRVSHPITTLIACPENMRIGYVGNGMYILAGNVLKENRFNAGSHVADGEFIIKAAAKYRTEYAPDSYAVFNAYMDGRWDIKDISKEIK
jgi:hypothetical protein